MRIIELTDEYMLKMLIKQANGFGASLRVRKHKKQEKFPFAISGKDEIGRTILMGGTAEWLYSELLKKLTDF